jgi:predicted Zn-dependent protease
MEGSINLYFVRSFHPYISPSTLGVGCRYHHVAYFNNAVRTGSAADNLGYTVAHELGHVLGNLGHVDQTVMASGSAGKADTLTEDQCDDARTDNTDMLANTL